MGFLDSVSATFNRGTAAAERTAKSVKLKSQISEIMRKRQQLAMQLGASLYEVTKDNPELRLGREALYDGIAQCDRERDDCQAQIDALEAEAAAATEAARTFECLHCHTRVSVTDMFCSGCGASVAEMKAQIDAQMPAQAQQAAASRACPQCGAPIGDEDMFCTSCGARIEAGGQAQIVNVETVGGAPAGTPAGTPQA